MRGSFFRSRTLASGADLDPPRRGSAAVRRRHEIGHHFGFSDADMDALENDAE